LLNPAQKGQPVGCPSIFRLSYYMLPDQQRKVPAEN
jgi:hypothetical protein